MSKNLPKEWRRAKSAPRGYWLRRSAFNNSNAHRHEINFRGHLIVLVNLRRKVKRNDQCIINGAAFRELPFDGNGFQEPLFAVSAPQAIIRWKPRPSRTVGNKGPESGHPVIVGVRPEGHPGARDAAQINEADRRGRIIGTGDLSHSVHHTN